MTKNFYKTANNNCLTYIETYKKYEKLQNLYKYEKNEQIKDNINKTKIELLTKKKKIMEE